MPNTSLPANGRFFLPDGVFSRALPFKQRLPTVDAYNVTLQHQLTRDTSVEVAYVGNKGTHVFVGDGPAANVNQATLEGFTAGVPRNNRRPYFNRFGWTQDIDFFCNCADNRYDSLQTKVTKRFTDGYSFLAHYTLQRALNNIGEQFFFNRELNRGPQDFDRTHNFVMTSVIELPFGRGKRYFTDVSRAMNLLVGGWQFNSTTTIQSGLPFNVGYDAGSNIDTGPNRPNLIGDPQTGGPRNRYFDPTVFGNPGRGNFGDLPRHALRGPGYWRTDASLFKKFIFSETMDLEFRIESVNFFNHVNLGNPESFIGNPASPNANAGVISSTAFFGADLQRNFQLALRFRF